MKPAFAMDGKTRIPLARAPKALAEPSMGTRNLLEQKGPQAVADWMSKQKKVLVTDTTMRVWGAQNFAASVLAVTSRVACVRACFERI